MRIVLTGASGFVGQALLQALESEHEVTACVRNLTSALRAFDKRSSMVLARMEPDQDWREILTGQQLVVHCAARVHMLNDRVTDAHADYQRINVEGTLNLARQAAQAGVKRFIFLSSIKVNGEYSEPGHPLAADDLPAPQDAYGRSKLEAEQQLLALAQQTGLEVVIIRPVLIYGAGVKANLHRLMQWVYRGIPLPFASIENQRSLLAMDNLVDLVQVCLSHPAAANQIFLASDGRDVSTPELVQYMAQALNRPARLWSMPVFVFKAMAWSLGRQALAQRLCGSLQVDISKTCSLLNWRPRPMPHNTWQCMAQTFLESSNA